MHPLQELIGSNGQKHDRGIYSCCSANEYVLKAALERGSETGTYVLIEATANQVNQYGGYTGMTPMDFMGYVRALARDCCFPEDRLLLGGDHLGPLTFAALPEAEAMKKAEALVEGYVLAGFTKIHLDTSMRLGSDSADVPLPPETVAARGAQLCAVCERAWVQYRQQNACAEELVYIIGSEVPIPGGAQDAEDALTVTTKAAAQETIDAYRRVFTVNGLEDAWRRVIGLVVQPGVEFGDSSIFEYRRAAAVELKEALTENPGMCFEAHSTDYQTRQALRAMVEDGFSILKVGPGLTFALREALFALDGMERELARRYGFTPSGLQNVWLEEMRADPSQWKNHYHGSAGELDFQLAYSFSDRARYYLPRNRVEAALSALLCNLEAHTIPLSLLSQYMPCQYRRVRRGALENLPEAIIIDKIKESIDDYLYATGLWTRDAAAEKGVDL